MKVNIIFNGRKGTGLSQDANILRGILTAVFDTDIQISGVNFNFPECPEADYNIFLEVINASLFPFARKNIWIPNLEWTYKTWQPYLDMVDEVWVKTHEAENVLKNVTTTPVRYIGWTSIDKVFKEPKNYHIAIIPIGKNIYRHPKPVFQAYLKFKEEHSTLYSKLPVLNVVYDPTAIQVTVPPQIEDKVILHSKVLKETEYDDLLHECGLCICLSLCEGFGHAVNEAMSAGCNLIVSPIPPFQENIVGSGDFYGDVHHSVQQPDCFGTYVDTSISSVVKLLHKYVTSKFKEHKAISLIVRERYESKHKAWIEFMKTFLKNTMISECPYVFKDTFPPEDSLPDVSIVTITRDRRIFMPLAKYSYMIQSYPEDKLEWVIIDDGDDSIEDTLIGVPNVVYVRCDHKMTISEKRNLGVQKAMYDVIVMMDDDDVYPNNSVLQRVAMLQKEPSKECGYCTTIPCYDIIKYSSFMNVPPRTLPISERVSEATLVFTRRFWEQGQFDNTVHVGEGNAFIRGREQMCREISPQEVIVSLTHSKNTSARKIPNFKEPNGCHFGFNENLFAVISEIGESLKSADQTEIVVNGDVSDGVGDDDRLRGGEYGVGDGDHQQPQEQQQEP